MLAVLQVWALILGYSQVSYSKHASHSFDVSHLFLGSHASNASDASHTENLAFEAENTIIEPEPVSIMRQRIDFTYEGMDFEVVLLLLERKTGLRFQYNTALVPSKRLYRLNYRNALVETILKDFFHQNGLDYEFLGNSLVLKPWELYSKEVVISGRISNRLTGERLVNATVSVLNTPKVVYSNSQGIFQMRISSVNRCIYSINYPGFQLQLDTLIGITPGKTYFLDIQLTPEIEQIEATLVQAKKDKSLPSVEFGRTDEMTINGSQLKNIPHLMGEPDVMRVFSMNPGVVSGSEGVFGMYVRGGASDQNLVLLDDVPLYNAYHMYGVFGIFNADIIKNAQFYRGSFPAEHGGRLSSVVEVHTVDGNANKYNLSLDLGVLSSRFLASGPLFNKKTTFVVSGRRSFFDFLIEPINRVAKFSDGDLINRYNFWDVNFKINHRFNPKSRLVLSGYSGQDYAGLVQRNVIDKEPMRLVQRSVDASRWGNDVLSLRWDYMSSPTSNIYFKAYYTTYKYANSRVFSSTQTNESGDESLERSNYELSNGLHDLETSLHFEKSISKGWKMRIGAGFIYHQFQPNRRRLVNDLDSVRTEFEFQDDAQNTPEVYSYASLNYVGGKWGFFDLGLRNVYYGLGNGQYYILPEPRFSARFKLSEGAWLKLAGSVNRQFFHQLNNITMGLPSDLWVPSNTLFKPAKSTQGSVGTSVKLSRNWQWNTEAFYREFDNILEYHNDAVYVTSNRNWESSVTAGRGVSQGIEAQIEKTKGRLTGWASYTLMKSDRMFAEINNGTPFPSRYDRRHNVYLAANYRINAHWNVSGSWVYNSGFAYTVPVGVFPSPTSTDPAKDILIYGDRNNTRSRDNHRLDASFRYVKRGDKYNQSWTFGVYNMYNRMNPFYINIGLDDQGNRSQFQISLLPVMPFVSYHIDF